jgi:hypothetical protein
MKRIAKISITGTAAGLALLVVGIGALAYFLVFDVCGNDPVATLWPALGRKSPR